MPNSIALAKQYVPVLDAIYKKECLTAVLDGNSDLVREGANAGELVIPKLSMQGLADYGRNSGYVNGDVTLTWETVAADYDRGRKFNVDDMDNKETQNVAFGKLASEFMRTKVFPELDAYRLAKYAGISGVGGVSAALSAGADVVSALRTATSFMDEQEVNEDDRYLFITPTLIGMVEDLDTTKSREVLARFKKVVRMPQARMYSAIDLLDGTTQDEEAGGYAKASGAKNMNFIVLSRSALIQFNKHVAPKIITPDVNQSYDGYTYAYRILSVCDVYDNKVKGVYRHISTT